MNQSGRRLGKPISRACRRHTASGSDARRRGQRSPLHLMNGQIVQIWAPVDGVRRQHNINKKNIKKSRACKRAHTRTRATSPPPEQSRWPSPLGCRCCSPLAAPAWPCPWRDAAPRRLPHRSARRSQSSMPGALPCRRGSD